MKYNKLSHLELNGQLIYEISFVIYFVIAFFQTSTYTAYFPTNLLHELAFIPLVLVLFKVFFYDSDTLKKIVVNILILSLLFITWRKSGEFILFPLGIFVLGARNIKFKRIIYIYLIVGTTLLAFIFFSSLMGLTKALTFYRDQNTVRRAFGIIYPTDFAAHVLYLVLAYCYLNFRKLSWKSYFIFVLIALFLIKFSDARLNAYALILVIPVMMIGQRAQKGYLLSKKIANFYWTLPILGCYLLTFISYIYSPGKKIMDKFDSLLSGRIALSHQALDRYGIKLFGQHVHENGFGAARGIKNLSVNMNNYFYIDSAFLRLLIIYGLIMAVIVILCMTRISWDSIKKGDYALASIMVIVTISAIVEQRLCDMGYDPFLIAALAQCYSKNIGVKNEDIYIK